MKQYLNMLNHILTNGVETDDRTGIGTISVFGYQNRYNLQEGFPLVTTKKMFFTGIVDELLWFLSGSTNINDLPERSRQLWSPWADTIGYLGPIYGEQWRNWRDAAGYNNIDQIEQLINEIKNNPTSRRMIVSSWNANQINIMALPPCHCLFQFNIKNGKLSCQLYQRSADAFLGVPFNIASYALLTHMIAQVCNLEVGEFIHTFGDLHIYKNHIEQVNLQLTREPLKLPHIHLNVGIRHIDDFRFDDIILLDYDSYSAIKGEVAV